MMNQNVKVTYNLSQAGQRAALLAGKTATATVTVLMILDDAELLDAVTIGTDGSLSLDASKKYVSNTGRFYSAPAFDAPPETLADVIAALKTVREKAAANEAEEKANREARESADVQRAAEKAAHDAPLVDALLAEYELLDPLAIPTMVSGRPYGRLIKDGYSYTLTPAQLDRVDALGNAHHKAQSDAKDAARAAKQAARDAMIAEHGGYRWEHTGLCNFIGFNLWSSGQTKRWVGIFTQPKGIARFLDSPRGEHTFDVSSLEPGQCIQGGGYDTNSRGKRRNESEWFGVVVSNAADALVVNICDSRSACFSAAKKISC